MYAIIETGGKQYPVSPGEEVKVEKLVGDVGSSVEFKALAVSPDDGDLVAGASAKSVKVTGTIKTHGRGENHCLQVQAPQDVPAQERPPAGVHPGEDRRTV